MWFRGIGVPVRGRSECGSHQFGQSVGAWVSLYFDKKFPAVHPPCVLMF